MSQHNGAQPPPGNSGTGPTSWPLATDAAQILGDAHPDGTDWRCRCPGPCGQVSLVLWDNALVGLKWHCSSGCHDSVIGNTLRLRGIIPPDDLGNKKLEIVHFDDITAQLGTRPLIKGVLEHQQLSLIVGETQSGKTFFALDQSLHVGAGKEWHGRKVAQGTAVYVAAEAGKSIYNRVAAFKIGHPQPHSIPFYVVPQAVDLCHLADGDLDRLITTIRQTTGDQIALITIDTVSRALAGGDENAPTDMGAFVTAMDTLRDEFGAHISAVHHLGKNHALGARGHSLLKANLDTEIEVTGTTDVRTAQITKQRDGVTGAVITFRLRQVLVGYNLDQDPIYSCVVDSTSQNQTAASRARPNGKLSDKQKIALDALRRALGAHGKPPPPSNYIPPDVMVVDDDLWRRFYLLGTSSEQQSENTRRKAWRDARDALVAKEYVMCINETAWLL
jgi:hypothetical protein